MTKFLFQEFFGKELAHANDLPPGSSDAELCKRTSDAFTAMVDKLRTSSYIDLQPINELAGLFWNLVGNQVSPVAISTGVPTLSFWCEIRQESSLAVVLCPPNWNRKFEPGNSKEVRKRAWSYEAELLRYFEQNALDFEPNEYQQHILREFPQGIASASHLHYQSRPYRYGDGPPFPLNIDTLRNL